MGRPEAGAEEEVDWDMPVGNVLDSLQVCHCSCSNVLYLPAFQSLDHHPFRQGEGPCVGRCRAPHMQHTDGPAAQLACPEYLPSLAPHVQEEAEGGVFVVSFSTTTPTASTVAQGSQG